LSRDSGVEKLPDIPNIEITAKNYGKQKAAMPYSA
jgi:hypothetical protein